jgi:hypothetical protein
MQTAPTLREDASYTSIGIVIAISGNILISLALNIQKVAHKHLHQARKYPNGSNGQANSSSNDTTPTIGLSRQASSTIIDTTPSFAESRPLLPRISTEPLPVQGYGAAKSKKLFNLPRINFPRRQPPPEPSLPSPEAPNGALDVDHHDDDELDETSKHTESDYLRSKLWYDIRVISFSRRAHASSLQVARFHPHEYRRGRQLSKLCICSCKSSRTSGNCGPRGQLLLRASDTPRKVSQSACGVALPDCSNF